MKIKYKYEEACIIGAMLTYGATAILLLINYYSVLASIPTLMFGTILLGLSRVYKSKPIQQEPIELEVDEPVIEEQQSEVKEVKEGEVI